MGHMYLCGMWLGVAPIIDNKSNVFRKDWIMSSDFVNHCRFNNKLLCVCVGGGGSIILFNEHEIKNCIGKYKLKNLGEAM